jgi:carbamoylphosphate synthase large subunit
MPVSIILFLVDGVKTEIDRQEFEERVTKMGLPPPKKGTITYKLESSGRTLLYVKDEIGQELTGKVTARSKFDYKITSYMVEECVLEKVAPEEVNLYQEQIKSFKKF